jgi:hypothetical protein
MEDVDGRNKSGHDGREKASMDGTSPAMTEEKRERRPRPALLPEARKYA